MRIKIIRGYGIAFILVLAFISYMSFTQQMPTKRPSEQTLLHSQVPEAADPEGDPPVAAEVGLGDALVYMEIPRFGEDWIWTVLEGTSLDIIDQGPGHFTETALPGEVGNSAYAAHRATHGDPFIDFEQLRVGDEVIISQTDAVWTYKITTEPTLIAEDADWVLDAFAPGRWVTLVTCWPKYGSEKRIYVRAKLVDNS